MQKIRKGDKVVVLTGKDKGRTGEVLQVMPKEDRAVVRGVNMVKRHQRQTADRRKPASSTRKPPSTCPTSRSPTPRTASRPASVSRSIDGKKVRVAKRSGGVDRWLRQSTSRGSRRNT